METTQITLSKETERGIILSQLNEKSGMLISFKDIAFLTGFSEQTVQRTISKKPDFPKPVDETLSTKNLLFVSGDIISWIRRHAPRFR